MGTLKKITVTTVTVTGRLVIIHLNSRLSIRYDILKATRPLCQTLEKAQNVSNSCFHRPQQTCTNPSFRCFFPLLARISAAQNFSIPTAVGRNFAVKWPILWPKVVVTRVKCHYWLRLFSSPPKLGGVPDRAGWSALGFAACYRRDARTSAKLPRIVALAVLQTTPNPSSLGFAAWLCQELRRGRDYHRADAFYGSWR